MSQSTNPFEQDADDSVLYPRHKDPFTKRTKSVKKLRKVEKKNIKQKHKQEKKEEKYRKKHSKIPNGNQNSMEDETLLPSTKDTRAPDNNGIRIETKSQTQNMSSSSLPNGSSTLPTSPNNQPKIPIPGYQTLHARSPTEDIRKSPVLPNKRIMQLKASGSDSAPIIPPSKDTTTKKQIYVPSAASPIPSVKDSVPAVRPNSLVLSSNGSQLLRDNDSNRNTSSLIGKGRNDDDVTRVRRSSSVSKVLKEKKKRKKKMKVRFKKKKKENSDRGDASKVLEDDEAMSQVVMRRKQETNLATLQKEVAETEDILRNSVVALVHQRDSMLEDMLHKSEVLEEKAYDFAWVANENRLKQQARSRCCGFGSRFRVCWYICACETGVKRKKKSSGIPGSPVSDKLLSPRVAADFSGETEDDCYIRTELKQKPDTTGAVESADAHDKTGYKGSTNSLTTKLTKIPASIRGSLPNLLKRNSPEKEGSSDGTFPRRKSSSVSSAQEVSKKTNKKQDAKERKEKEKREQSYRSFVDSKFEDDDRRSRAFSLLRMDDKPV